MLSADAAVVTTLDTAAALPSNNAIPREPGNSEERVLLCDNMSETDTSAV